MPVATAWRSWGRRALGLGIPRLLLGLAFVLTFIALWLPLWSFTVTAGPGDYSTTDFTWTAMNTQEWSGGALNLLTSQPYSAPGFNFHGLASAIGASYLLFVVFAVVLLLVFVILSLPLAKRLSPILLFALAIVVVAVALAALFYPVLTIASPAATDMQIPSITSFFGSGLVPGRSERYVPPGALDAGTGAWGAGLGWYLVLVAVVLAIAGGVMPYLKAMFRPTPPPPRDWQPRQ